MDVKCRGGIFQCTGFSILNINEFTRTLKIQENVSQRVGFSSALKIAEKIAVGKNRT